LAEEAEGRHAASTPRKTPLLIIGGILVLVAVGVLVFVLTGGSDGPLGQAVGADTPETPAFDFKVSKPKVVVRIKVLIDPKGLPYSAVGVVKFEAKGTGAAVSHVFVSKGQYILQKIDGEWTVVSFSVGREDKEKATPSGSGSPSASAESS
jgi:hypothetical protein